MKKTHNRFAHVSVRLIASLMLFPNSANAITSTLYVSDALDHTLHTVSISDASTTLVGDYVYDAWILGLAYNSTDNLLYGSGRYESDGNWSTGQLFTINKDTGEATIVGPHGDYFPMSGLAYDPISNTLFGTYGPGGDESLYSIDPMTGSATLIGSLGGYQIHGLAFDPITNILYGSAYTEPPGEAAFLSIDRATGFTTLINTTTQSLAGISFDPVTGILYGVDDGGLSGTYTTGLYEVDKATGQTSLIGYVPLSNPHGLEFVASIPIPSAIILFGSGFLGMMGLSRRLNVS